MSDKPFHIGWADGLDEETPISVSRTKSDAHSIPVFASPVGHQDVRVATLAEVEAMVSDIGDPAEFVERLKVKLAEARSIVTFDDTRAHGHGHPDKCFYCSAETGTRHDDDCVCLRKAVKYRVTMELTVQEPQSWDKEMCEFARNESTWCASNIVDWIENHEEQYGCLCASAKFEVVEMGDAVAPHHRRALI